MAAPDLSGAIERWTRRTRCPVCGGSQDDARGKGVRCSGYRSSDGDYLYCSREEHAGGLSVYGNTDCYLHRASGPCKCGTTHGDAPAFMEKATRSRSRADSRPKAKAKTWPSLDAAVEAVERSTRGTVAARYPYEDEQGSPVLVVLRVRLPDDEHGNPQKTFRQASPEGSGWKLSAAGVPLVPFHLRDLRAAIEAGDPIHIVEGEKDVLAVEAAGGVATCNVGGAGKPKAIEACIPHFKGADLVRIVADQDADGKGQRHAEALADALDGIAERIELVRPVEGKDAADALAAGHDLADAFQPLEADKTEWETPSPFGDRELPAFPFDALPDPLRDLSAAVSENVDASPDLVACAGLGVASVLTTGRVSVRMSDSWTPPIALYLAMLATSGDGKGPAIRFASDPLRAAQADLREAERDRVERERTEYDMLKRRADKLAQDAAKSTGEDAGDIEAQATQAAIDLARRVRPEVPRYYVGDDCTEAAMAGALVANQQRLGIVSAEARTLFDGAGGRFSNGTPEMRLLLSGYDGEPCEQLRVGRGEVDLSHPQLSVAIALQPSAFESFAKRGDMVDAGLFNRFLIARPKWAGDLDRMPSGEVPRPVRERWAFLVRDLVRIPDRGHHGWLLDFTPEARSTFDAIRLRFRQMRRDGGLFAAFDAYAPKFDANVCRLVGLLHCAELAAHGESADGYDGKPIGVETVERAARIADYFAHHAAATFAAAGMDERERRAQIILKRCSEWSRTSGDERIYRQPSGRLFVDVRTLQRDAAGDRRILKNRADVIDGCGLLVELGWLRKADQRPKKGRGPTGSWYELHPTAFAD